VIDQMAVEWRSLGRTGQAVRVLREIAGRDRVLGVLVLGDGGGGGGGAGGGGGGAPSCPTPCDLVAHMRRASGRTGREEAAHIVRVLLREANTDPFVARLLIQALVPGLINVAGKLRWGQGGDWRDGEEFFGELLATAWCVIAEWAGQDRRYAVLDLLSAIRCRVRRQLFHAKDLAERTVPTEPERVADRAVPSETALDELARTVVDECSEGMPTDEADVLYSHSVLGYSISELAVLTGRSRRGLYTRRDRARRRLCA
jgi:DNA-directed RNA polymerase specialized sigma24 family protein